MTDVTDLSPGTRLKAGTTGWTYTVTEETDEKVRVRGPNGPLMPIQKSKLQREIAQGKIQVIG